MSQATKLEDLVPNAQLGHYSIIAHVAEGGMGHVFRAFEPSLQREVAIKVLKADFAANPQYRAFFDSEALNIAALRHPSIVPIYFVGSQGDLCYFVMPYIEGSTLDEWVEKEVPMTVEQGMWVMSNAVEALEWALHHHIVHLDIKPSNFLVDNNGSILLTDFGLAKSLVQSGGDESQECFGTPAYISPEQIMRQPADQRSDIYSLGATLYHLLTMHFLYDGESVEAIVLSHLEKPFPYQEAESYGLSPGWINLIDRMTQKKPEDRFQNYDELREAVRNINALRPVQIRSSEKTKTAIIPVPIRESSTKEFLYGLLRPRLASWAQGGIDTALVKERQETLQQIQSSSRQLANLTPALKELAQVMEGDIDDLSGALEYMPSMDRFIIALANTPFFQPEEFVTKRKKALRTIGFGLGRNLVLTGMMIREHGAKSYEFDWHPLWQHSISVGLVSTFLMNLLEEDAKRVSSSGRLGNFKDKYLHKLFAGNLGQQAYFQGLIHDLGKMLLAEIGAYPYFVAVRRSLENHTSLAGEEKKVMGVDHMEAGALWFQRQGFEGVTREVAGNHRTDIDKASPLCCAVALSNQIVKRHGLGFSGNGIFERRDFGELSIWLELKKHFHNKITTMEMVEAEFIPMVGQLPLLEPIDG